MDSWKLLPRPERLTELYFTDHTKLPTSYKPDIPQTITFTVHNLEHQTTLYRYTLTARAAGKEQALGEGTAELAHNNSQKITRTIAVPALDSRVEVRVHLQYDGIPFGQDMTGLKAQTIHYWINRAAAKAGGV